MLLRKRATGAGLEVHLKLTRQGIVRKSNRDLDDPRAIPGGVRRLTRVVLLKAVVQIIAKPGVCPVRT